MNTNTLAFGMPGTTEWIIIAVIALLIFGRRLPEVARSVGKSIVEFKKGIKDVKGDIDDRAAFEPPAKQPRIETAPTAQADASAVPSSQPTPDPAVKEPTEQGSSAAQ